MKINKTDTVSLKALKVLNLNPSSNASGNIFDVTNVGAAPQFLSAISSSTAAIGPYSYDRDLMIVMTAGSVTPAQGEPSLANLNTSLAMLAFLSSGEGSPEGAVTAGVGSLYIRTDGGTNTTLYVKESGSGNTGWAGK